jgi:hypothetical protein
MPDETTIAYRPAVVTFLDVLGFRERVASSRDATDIQRILSRLRSFSNNDAEEESLGGDGEFEVTRSIAFSDSVVRIRFIDTPYPSGALFHEILGLVHMQAEMMASEVLLRGGVTVGNVYLEGDMAFGPAFNRAYDLESQFANVPRIVIGPEAFVELRNDNRLVSTDNTADHDIAYIRRMLKCGEDGLWFIDYLAAIRSELDDLAQYPDLISQNRSLILDNIRRVPAHSRVFQKYLWSAHYLNEVIDRCGLSSALRLTQADIPALDALEDRPDWMGPAGDSDFIDIA